MAYVYGNWRDSKGSLHQVRFKKTWGEHIFTEDEKQRLLNGEIISFLNKGKLTRGHLQYCIALTGRKYFGFCPTFNEYYVTNPVYDSTIINDKKESNFRDDKSVEAMINQFMRIMYYDKLCNHDGTKVKCEFIEDGDRQKQGIDVIFIRDGKNYIIDEKSQNDYIFNEKGPLNTFALELRNSASGKLGWFINNELKTEYYMFIWPHANIKPLCVENIEYVKYALVSKKMLKNLIVSVINQSDEGLYDYSIRITKGMLIGSNEKGNRVYYKEEPFNQDVYLVYTKDPNGNNSGKVEQPVNLVVRKNLIDSIAEEKGIIYKK